MAGNTLSANFPTTPGAFDNINNPNEVFDVFVTKLNPAGSALVYSTFLGGTGTTSSPNFPTTVDALDTTFNGGPTDVFVTKLNPAGSAPLVYSTFFGGSGNDQETGIADDEGIGIALDIFGGIYVAGATRSPNFPTTAGAFDTTHNGVSDAFVAKLSAIDVAATLTLNPPTATNPVDSQHCVTPLWRTRQEIQSLV